MEQEAVSYKTNMKELLLILLKHHGIHEGKYNLAVEFKVGIGPVKFDNTDDPLIPSASVGISKIGLIQNDDGADAAVLNPRRKPRKKASTAE
ncbi:hypothetical protein [Microvirgula aerodenitrificans]|uniref:hypothetical protein n=1 Tax=Microvirgula aerodenitrificans TaxID=57480 RepID=UPI00248EEBD3|nr:hypothetical protein [Microvirgula aerodenitrificans]